MNTTPPPPAPHTPEDIKLRSAAEVPTLLLPEPQRLFAERALRLRQLAAAHPMREYLLLLAVVCEAQHTQAHNPPALLLPTPEQQSAAQAAGKPLLDANTWQRAPQWREALRTLLQQVLEKLPPDSPARATVQAAKDLSDAALEQQADRLLAGISLGLDMATAPLVAAGLQLHYAQLVAASAAALPGAFPVPAHAPHCPCCASAPVASITRLGGAQEGQRYLQCSLCSAQWQMPRIQCAHCGTAQGIEYQSLQPLESQSENTKRPAVEVETCKACQHYLKIVHMGQDLHVEPMADDLATLTLDLLIAETGLQRHGANLLLLFGDGEAEPGEH